VKPTLEKQASHWIEDFELVGVIPKVKYSMINTVGSKQ
jgi:hypothetical protein